MKIVYALSGVILLTSFAITSAQGLPIPSSHGKTDEAAIQAVAKQMTRLADKNPKNRQDAVRALGKLRWTAKDAVPKLVELLRDKSPMVRNAAAQALGQIVGANGRNAKQAEMRKKFAAMVLPGLMEMLNDKGNQLRHTAITAISQLGPNAAPAVQPLIKQLKGKEYDRLLAVDALGCIGPKAAAAIPHLIATLGDRPQNPLAIVSVRNHAVIALGRIGPVGIKPLVKTLDHKNAEFRAGALGALLQMGKKAAPTVAPVTAALDDPDYFVRLVAVRTLRAIGPAAQSATPDLLRRLVLERPRGMDRLTYENYRSHILYTLADNGIPANADAKAIVATLIPLLRERDYLRGPSARILGSFGSKSEPAIDALIKSLAKPNEPSSGVYYRSIAVRTLGKIGLKAIPALTKSLKDKSPNVRRAAEAALKRIRASLKREK